MAGAGYKLFNAYDVLTAAQVNTYLMQQTVMVFANSTARTSALSSVLAEGMVSYLQDTNTLEVYDGSAWVGATGDITALTASTGISITSPTGPVPTVAIDTAVVPQLAAANTFTGGVQQITTASAATKGLIVKGTASQSANLQEWQDSTGTVLTNISSAGGIETNGGMRFYTSSARSGFSTLTNTGGALSFNYDFALTSKLTVTAGAAATVPMTVKGAASQTANLQEWQDSAGTVLASFTPNGSATFLRNVTIGSGTLDATARVVVTGGAATDVKLQVKGVASQTADLQQWQNSAGTVLSYVKSDGTIFVNFNDNTAGIFFKGTSGDQKIRTNGNDMNISPFFDGIFAPANSAGRFRPTGDNTSDLGTTSQRWKVVNASSGLLVNSTAGNIVLTVKGAASQSASLQEWQNSAGTALALVNSTGTVIGVAIQTTSALSQISEENSGGRLRLTKMTASPSTTSTDLLKLYVVAGTLPGTLKLAVRAGTGAETTVLDNIPQ